MSVPAAKPFTMPVEEPIDAIDGLDTVHVPPGAASVNVVLPPTQIEDIPNTGASAFTVRFLTE